MAIILEDISIIVPLRHLSFQRQGPVGFIAGSAWHDQNLYCDVVGNVTQLGERIVDWTKRRIEPFDWKSPDRHWGHLCIASVGFGPHGPCDWLEYDPATETAWLKGSERGDAFGGAQQYFDFLHRLSAARAAAEECYTRMYDSRYPKEDRDDALGFLSEAIRLAKLLNYEAEIAELKARYESIIAVYSSQFRN